MLRWSANATEARAVLVGVRRISNGRPCGSLSARRLGATEFLGYDTGSGRSGRHGDRARRRDRRVRLRRARTVLMLCNQTPFYAESGGQVGDRRVTAWLATWRRAITETTKKVGGSLRASCRRSKPGPCGSAPTFELAVDHTRRSAIRANHSATHLLHEALRQVLGDHIAQKGSLVAPDRLRFDFSHPKAISDAELASIEDLANRVVLENAPVETRLMGGRRRDRVRCARALFGEKYGDEVRVVSMGIAARRIDNCGPSLSRSNYAAGRMSPAPAISGSYRSCPKGLSHQAFGASRQRPAPLARRHHLNTAGSPVVRRRVDRAGTGGRTRATRGGALVEERRKLERELADVRKKLAMGGGAARHRT